MPLDRYQTWGITCTAVILVAVVVTLWFPVSIDYSGLPINGTSQPTKIAAQTVPTIVNGIVTMTSIIITFGGLLCGTLVFREMANNPEEKSKYYEGLGFFILPPMYLWISYVLLGVGLFEFAFKYALVGFIFALLILILFYLAVSRKLRLNREKELESDKAEKDRQKDSDSKKSEQNKIAQVVRDARDE